ICEGVGGGGDAKDENHTLCCVGGAGNTVKHKHQLRGGNKAGEPISFNWRGIRGPQYSRRAAKSGQVLVRTQKANTPARCGWNADRAQPFLVIAARDASSISDDRQKKGAGFGPERRNRKPGHEGGELGGDRGCCL